MEKVPLEREIVSKIFNLSNRRANVLEEYFVEVCGLQLMVGDFVNGHFPEFFFGDFQGECVVYSSFKV